ncbi:Dnase i-like superfamily protein, partial [Thalictrum thalictroides]
MKAEAKAKALASVESKRQAKEKYIAADKVPPDTSKKGRGRPKGSRGWSFLENYDKHTAGRIWVCWNDNEVEVHKLEESKQHIHCNVTILSSNSSFLFTCIYASNDRQERLLLWKDIINLYRGIKTPWCVLGDFNNVLYSHERVGRSLVHPSETTLLSDCLIEAGLSDLNFTGLLFTWSNNSEGSASSMSKIDRCLVNGSWVNIFRTQAEFLPQGISDHSPILLFWFTEVRKSFPFRFNNAWTLLPGFKELVAKSWNITVYSNPMQALVVKQKLLKAKLKIWVKNNCSKLHEKVQQALGQLEDYQKQLHNNPSDILLCRLERRALRKYCNLAAAEHNQIKQKAGCDWLTMGDRPSAYFHNAVKEKSNRKAIRTMEDRQGNKLNSENDIISEILDYYMNLFGEGDDEVEAEIIRELIFSKQITEEESCNMMREVEDDEIKN